MSNSRFDGSGMRVVTPPRNGTSRSDFTIRLPDSPDLAGLIEGLSADLEMPTIETTLLALVLLRIVVDGGKQGKRLAFTDEDLDFVQEILIPGHADANG